MRHLPFLVTTLGFAIALSVACGGKAPNACRELSRSACAAHADACFYVGGTPTTLVPVSPGYSGVEGCFARCDGERTTACAGDETCTDVGFHCVGNCRADVRAIPTCVSDDDRHDFGL